MLSIRLSRVGKKNQPDFRLILTDRRRDPWGKAIEILGHRNPRTKETTLKTERIQYWLGQGAQPTKSVWNLFIDRKLVDGKKRPVTHISKKRSAKLVQKQSEEKKTDT